MKYVIKTSFTDAEIKQESYFENKSNEIRSAITNRILYLEDEEVRKALIALGWTPPMEKKKVNCKSQIYRKG